VLTNPQALHATADAVAARDVDALARLSVDVVDHTAHLTFDRRDLSR
jgi:hypothetical protein